jgi:hypothetical protein
MSTLRQLNEQGERLAYAAVVRFNTAGETRFDATLGLAAKVVQVGENYRIYPLARRPGLGIGATDIIGLDEDLFLSVVAQIPARKVQKLLRQFDDASSALVTIIKN